MKTDISEGGLEIFGRLMPPVDGKVRHEPFHSYTLTDTVFSITYGGQARP